MSCSSYFSVAAIRTIGRQGNIRICLPGIAKYQNELSIRLSIWFFVQCISLSATTRTRLAQNLVRLYAGAEKISTCRLGQDCTTVQLRLLVPFSLLVPCYFNSSSQSMSS